MELKFHHKIIESFRAFNNFDLLWVIGPSTDGTYQDLLAKNQEILKTTHNSRASRINEGIAKAKNDLVLLHHPRSFLSFEALTKLSRLRVPTSGIWGGFTHKFYQMDQFLLNFTSFYSNFVRFDKRGIVYLDHCIFMTKNLIDEGDKTVVPEIDIFEDTQFSKKLLKKSQPLRIKEISNTSAVRFSKNGVYKQSYLNQKLKLMYYFGFSTEKMNQSYEKNLNLNSKY